MARAATGHVPALPPGESSPAHSSSLFSPLSSPLFLPAAWVPRCGLLSVLCLHHRPAQLCLLTAWVPRGGLRSIRPRHRPAPLFLLAAWVPRCGLPPAPCLRHRPSQRHHATASPPAPPPAASWPARAPPCGRTSCSGVSGCLARCASGLASFQPCLTGEIEPSTSVWAREPVGARTSRLVATDAG